MAQHEKRKVPLWYRGRHARPSATANIAKATGIVTLAATAAVGTAAAAHAAPLPVEQVSVPQVSHVATASHTAYIEHLDHIRHLEHLNHLAQEHALPDAPVHTVSATLDVNSGVFSPTQLGALWVAAGGNPAAVGTAECIAMHESAGRADAISPTDDYGLWQINASNGALATLIPLANAHSAVILSHDGTNWSPWTTAPMCGV